MYSLCGCGAWFDHGQARRTRCDRCMHSLTADGAKKKHRPRPRRRKHGPFVCLSPACRREYMAKAPDRNTYCSRGCQVEHKRVRAAYRAHLEHDAHVPALRACDACGHAGTGFLRTCESCSRERDRIGVWAQRLKGTVIACSTCNVLFSPLLGNHGRATCSDACERERKRDAKRAARRIRRRRAGGNPDRVVRLRVFWRDKWKCRSCGCKAPQRLMGSLEPNAPERDHSVPLAAGGTHTWANVQLLCRSCNGRKSRGALGDQLLLFGDA